MAPRTRVRVNFLQKIPAELRNAVYDLVFNTTPHQHSHTKVDLLRAQPPEHTLLLVCRQIHDEARQIYDLASRNF